MREATALAEVGYDVTVVDLEPDRSRPRQEDADGVHLHHLVVPSYFVQARFKPWFLVKLARVLARGALVVSCSAADAYHAHDYMALPACYVAARLRHKPLVFDAHELPFVQPQLTRWRRLCALGTRALRTMAPRCAAVITVSAPIARELRRTFGGPEPVLVRNVPEYQPPAQASDELRRRLDLPPSTHIALYQGALSANRSLDVLVRAGRYLGSNQVIVLLGDGPLKGTLEQLIVAEGVGDRVKLVPAVPYHELLAYTASADLGLIVYRGSYAPDVQFCLPNKLFEYLMAGLPVLASPLDAVAELLAHYDAGMVVPSLEPEVVAQAIGALLGDEQRRVQLRHHALAAATTDLRWDVECRQLTALYERLPLPMAPGSSSSAHESGSGSEEQ